MKKKSVFLLLLVIALFVGACAKDRDESNGTQAIAEWQEIDLGIINRNDTLESGIEGPEMDEIRLVWASKGLSHVRFTLYNVENNEQVYEYTWSSAQKVGKVTALISPIMTVRAVIKAKKGDLSPENRLLEWDLLRFNPNPMSNCGNLNFIGSFLVTRPLSTPWSNVPAVIIHPNLLTLACT
jgi:hypothetical protein